MNAHEHELGLLPIGEQQGVCLLLEGVTHIEHGSSGAEAEGDLDDGHGEGVAGVCVTRVVWGHEVRAHVDEAVVDECGIHGRAHLRDVVKCQEEHECSVHCMGCGLEWVVAESCGGTLMWLSVKPRWPLST